jgi:MFS family permease
MPGFCDNLSRFERSAYGVIAGAFLASFGSGIWVFVNQSVIRDQSDAEQAVAAGVVLALVVTAAIVGGCVGGCLRDAPNVSAVRERRLLSRAALVVRQSNNNPTLPLLGSDVARYDRV